VCLCNSVRASTGLERWCAKIIVSSSAVQPELGPPPTTTTGGAPEGTEEEGTPPTEAELLAELQGMKMRLLQKRAEVIGVEEDKLDEAEERSEVIALIVAKVEEGRAKAAAAAQVKADAEAKAATDAAAAAKARADVDAAAAAAKAHVEAEIQRAQAEAEAAWIAPLKEELEGMKMRALQRRAEELHGVDDEELDEAEEKSDVIALILELATKPSPGCSGGEKAAAVASSKPQ
jgi:colicin import membrane protein